MIPLHATLRRILLAGILVALAGSCASVEFTRDTQTSGYFEATGRAVTILGWDLPKGAVEIARENASDARRPNMVVEEVTISPHWGALNWLLEILSVRKAELRGSWGFRGD